MSLLTLRKYWKKLRSWCFHHWRWLVFASGALLLFCLGRRSNKELFRQAKASLKMADLESKAIERKHRTEIKLREKARVKYDNNPDEIDKLLLKEFGIREVK